MIRINKGEIGFGGDEITLASELAVCINVLLDDFTEKFGKTAATKIIKKAIKVGLTPIPDAEYSEKTLFRLDEGDEEDE